MTDEIKYIASVTHPMHTGDLLTKDVTKLLDKMPHIDTVGLINYLLKVNSLDYCSCEMNEYNSNKNISTLIRNGYERSQNNQEVDFSIKALDEDDNYRTFKGEEGKLEHELKLYSKIKDKFIPMEMNGIKYLGLDIEVCSTEFTHEGDLPISKGGLIKK